MPYKRKLPYGKTPFDSMSITQLTALLTIYLKAASSALGVFYYSKQPEPYWERGPGGKTLTMLEHIASIPVASLKTRSGQELNHLMKKVYDALASGRGVLAMHQDVASRRPDYNSGFWLRGAGAEALAEVQNCLDLIPYDNNELYSAYYRAAGPALWKGVCRPDGTPLYTQWWLCEGCESYTLSDDEKLNAQPHPCLGCGPGTIVREMTLEDTETWYATHKAKGKKEV